MPTHIEWTDETWNPIRGCSRVSEGCRNCYAEKMAARFSKGKTIKEEHIQPAMPYHGVIENGKWNGKIKFVPEHLEDPLKWKKPKKIFVNSMSDLFHENVPLRVIQKVWDVMGRAPRHTFQILTKRPVRMMRLLNMCSISLPLLPNVHLGVSVEDQKTVDERVDFLLRTPAAVRWISYEPALGPIKVNLFGKHLDPDKDEGDDFMLCQDHGMNRCFQCLRDGISWLVCGGESGPGARPMHPEWVRSIRDQCSDHGVPFFFKQWGAWIPINKPWDEESPAHCARNEQWLNLAGGQGFHGSEVYRMRRVGKGKSGRGLDGRTHEEFPESVLA